MINYYYVIYVKRNNKIEIHLIPFDTREKAKDFKIRADEHYKEKGIFVFSKILKRDLNKHENEFWL